MQGGGWEGHGSPAWSSLPLPSTFRDRSRGLAVGQCQGEGQSRLVVPSAAGGVCQGWVSTSPLGLLLDEGQAASILTHCIPASSAEQHSCSLNVITAVPLLKIIGGRVISLASSAACILSFSHIYFNFTKGLNEVYSDMQQLL